MKIVLIEDEKPAVARLRKLLNSYFPTADYVDNLDSIESALAYFTSNPEPDLIFCDIQLADGTSFEIFKQVKLSTPIVFTTAYDQYAIKAFEVNAIDYLLKPIDSKELEKSVQKFHSRSLRPHIDSELLKAILRSNSKAYKSRFLVKFGDKIQSIPTDEVAFFYSEQRVAFLQTIAGKQYVVDGNLEKTEEQVDPDLFFRLNRKYLVADTAIDEIYSYSNSRLKVKLKNCTDSDILVSREKVSDFKQWLDR